MNPSVKHLVNRIKNDLSKVAENYLFEPNDQLTRNQIKNNMSSYLDNIKSQRGLYDFRVVCDESNNPPSNNPPIDTEESLLQNLPDDLENYLIESDENEDRLFYHDILYRVLNKKNNKIICYFEEHEILTKTSGFINVDMYLQPPASAEYVILNIKIT